MRLGQIAHSNAIKEYQQNLIVSFGPVDLTWSSDIVVVKDDGNLVFWVSVSER